MSNYLIFTNSITVILYGKTYTVKKSDANYERVVELAKNKQEEELLRLLSTVSGIENKLGVSIVDGIVSYNGEVLPTSLNRMIMCMYEQDVNTITPLINFWNKLKSNPAYHPVSFLSDFIESNNIVINEQGNLILYKIVARTNESNVFLDLYTRKIKQTFGVPVEVPRNEVDDDIDTTCSHGLNFVASY